MVIFVVNAVLMTFAIKILGPKFSIKTTFAIFGLTFFLWFFQLLVNGSPPRAGVTSVSMFVIIMCMLGAEALRRTL